jgi:hypothetical protein
MCKQIHTRILCKQCYRIINETWQPVICAAAIAKGNKLGACGKTDVETRDIETSLCEKCFQKKQSKK